MDYSRTDIIETYILDYKNKILQQGRLELIAVKEDAVHGLNQVERWLEKHSSLMMLPKDTPKGILLGGIPGTGKSAMAHMAAKKFNLPLAKLEMSKILGGHVADSEKGMKEEKEFPACMKKNYQNHEKRRQSNVAEDWYDVIFYDELVKAMGEVLVFDKENTLEATRMEYLKYKGYKKGYPIENK